MDLISHHGEWVHALAPAKVNLFLHITGRREDGYHELESLFVFTDFGDEIRVRTADDLSLNITGPFASDLSDDSLHDNLVMRAARGVRDITGVAKGAEIILQKNLPIAAGIGGGSADAAATIRALEALWDVDLDEASRLELAQSLGADVSACLDAGPKLVRGIGEKMEPFEVSRGLFIVLANPGIALSTPAVFGAYAHADAGFSDARKTTWDWHGVLAAGNDLQASAMRLAPDVEKLLGTMGENGHALKVGMSGSGATCFALFETQEDAKNCEQGLKETTAGVWSNIGQILGIGH